MSTQDPSILAARPTKRLTIFRASEARPIQDHMPVYGANDAVVAGIGKVNAANPTDDPNVGARALLLFAEPGEQGMSLSYVWFKSGYILPRHSHSSDCLYYVMAGALRLGNKILRKGDGMFIPANAGYTYEAGPEGVEVLEFRNATQFHFLFKNNDEKHWERIANVLRNNAERWATEMPPSERGGAVRSEEVDLLRSP